MNLFQFICRIELDMAHLVSYLVPVGPIGFDTRILIAFKDLILVFNSSMGFVFEQIEFEFKD